MQPTKHEHLTKICFIDNKGSIIDIQDERRKYILIDKDIKQMERDKEIRARDRKYERHAAKCYELQKVTEAARLAQIAEQRELFRAKRAAKRAASLPSLSATS